MRRALTIVACAALGSGLVGCGNPAGPDIAEKTAKVVGYTCYTQPREYVTVNPDGTVTRTMEVDWYYSAEPCPTERIK